MFIPHQIINNAAKRNTAKKFFMDNLHVQNRDIDDDLSFLNSICSSKYFQEFNENIDWASKFAINAIQVNNRNIFSALIEWLDSKSFFFYRDILEYFFRNYNYENDFDLMIRAIDWINESSAFFKDSFHKDFEADYFLHIGFAFTLFRYPNHKFPSYIKEMNDKTIKSSINVIKYFLEVSEKVVAKNLCTDSIKYAIFNNNIELAKIALKNNPDIITSSLIKSAVSRNNFYMVQLLLNHIKTNALSQPSFDNSILYVKSKRMLGILLSNGIDASTFNHHALRSALEPTKKTANKSYEPDEEVLRRLLSPKHFKYSHLIQIKNE